MTLINIMNMSPAPYADGTTDDSGVFQDAIDSLPVTGGAIYVPTGYYRIAQRLRIDKNIHIYGDNAGIRSYRYGDPHVSNWDAYTGSVLIFDSNTAGLFFPSHTDVADPPTVYANAGGSGSNATYWQYSGANHSIVERLVLYSQGGTSATAHGIEARHNIHVRDTIVFRFGGHGLLVSASVQYATSPATTYGNANRTSFTNVFSTTNRGCGFRIEGRDANVIKLDNCDAMLNGSWGFSDSGFLGNTYVNCHAATNNTLAASYPSAGASSDASVGSFMADDINAPHVYLGCYSEGGNGAYAKMTNACQVLGGILSSAGQDNPGQPFVLRAGVAREAPITHFNQQPSVDIAVDLGGGSTSPRILAFGTSDQASGLHSGQRSLELLYYSTNKAYSLEQPSASQTSQIGFCNALTDVRKIAPFFKSGLFLGSPINGLGGLGPHIGWTNAASPPNGVYKTRDIIFKGDAQTPVAGDKIGWVCTAGGVKASAWTSGETSLYIYSSPSSRVYRENGGRVYALTVSPNTGVGVLHAPTHASGTVTDAQGYGWTFMNANTLPTFKQWGAIDA